MHTIVFAMVALRPAMLLKGRKEGRSTTPAAARRPSPRCEKGAMWGFAVQGGRASEHGLHRCVLSRLFC